MKDLDFLLSSIHFENDRKEDPEINKRIDAILKNMEADPSAFHVARYFKDPDFFNSLPEHVKSSNEELASYIENSEKFDRLIHPERTKRWKGEQGLFGEEVSIEESLHHDGRTRRAEDGYVINVDYLTTIGIDPNKVLFFRLTQPSETPKPEYYWTSDYFETTGGLTAEISPEKRISAVILVADIQTINENHGLIQDVNDDQGLAVRQIGLGYFDQNRCLARITSH